LFLRDPVVLDDESEVASIRQLQKDIIERKTGKEYPGSSPLRLGTLLYLVDYTHSVQSSRATMVKFFLSWFDIITKIGYVRELEPFLALKHFIEVGRLYSDVSRSDEFYFQCETEMSRTSSTSK
jgi:hypothetical protein